MKLHGTISDPFSARAKKYLLDPSRSLSSWRRRTWLAIEIVSCSLLVVTALIALTTTYPIVSLAVTYDTPHAINLSNGAILASNQNASWPTFMHDPQHTGRSSYLGAQTNDLKWKFDTGASIESSPVVGSNGTIYLGSSDNELYAINSDGTLKWKFETAGIVQDSPTIGSDGTVYVGSYDNSTYAINSDGTLKWKFATGGYIRSSPAIGSDGTVFVGSWDDYVYAVNSDGTLKWKFDTESYMDSSFALGSDGSIYFGSYDSNVYAVNPDGTLKWTFKTGNGILSSPAIGSNGIVYIGSGEGYLYALGTSNPSLTYVDSVTNSPWTDQATILTARVVGNSPTGNVTWTSDSSTGYFSSPTTVLSAGNCVTTYADSSAVTVEITASYSGDSNNAPSNSSIFLTVIAQSARFGSAGALLDFSFIWSLQFVESAVFGLSVQRGWKRKPFDMFLQAEKYPLSVVRDGETITCHRCDGTGKELEITKPSHYEWVETGEVRDDGQVDRDYVRVPAETKSVPCSDCGGTGLLPVDRQLFVKLNIYLSMFNAKVDEINVKINELNQLLKKENEKIVAWIKL